LKSFPSALVTEIPLTIYIVEGFVDFQKAFDTVIHTGIKIKLLHAGVGSLFYNIISRMYEISKSCVKVSKIEEFS
jgi:hypothetical protein